ncbi:hypothetical protein [Brachybacterium muris]|uniref:hypothetical protein n=1 Tax=Brachybacterium muris TaxID=219301 RepID=UPI00223ADEBF|nr:hypothetical protein [Brachybacterium muris]MCT1654777.1 hypothetical protein [Brachybacterium muris]MCT2177300.1 hypothetical protein [Brachybacterium muris]
MTDQLMILAEAGAAAEGIPAYLVGLGMLIILLGLLGITYLAGGVQRSGREAHRPAETRTTAHHHDTAASDH